MPGPNQTGESMKMNLHAPTRRELLLASGTLFAWAYLPKRALAEGRDPRLLVMVLRGPAPVLAWTPPRLPPANEDTMMRLLDLYRHTDPSLARVLEERMGLAAIARAGGMDAGTAQNGQPRSAGVAQVRAYFAES